MPVKVRARLTKSKIGKGPIGAAKGGGQGCDEDQGCCKNWGCCVDHSCCSDEGCCAEKTS